MTFLNITFVKISKPIPRNFKDRLAVKCGMHEPSTPQFGFNYFGLEFQQSLFLRITTLLSWLKSTLLLKNNCYGSTIYMKTQWDAALFGKGKFLGAGGGVERVALIKSLIYAR